MERRPHPPGRHPYPQVCTARDLLAATRRPPSRLTPSRPRKRSGAGLGIMGPPAQGSVPRACSSDLESCESSCGLSSPQNWAPSFRAGPSPRLLPGRWLPPTLSAGSMQPRAPKARIVPRGFSQGSHRGEAQRRTAVAQSLLDFVLGVSGGAGPEPSHSPRSTNPGVQDCLLAE